MPSSIKISQFLTKRVLSTRISPRTGTAPGGGTAEEAAAINALEGQERANEMCRVLYELNSLAQVQEGYCCQGVYIDLMGDNAAEGLITSATTVTLSEEVITITAPDTNDYEVSYGAVLFNIPETEAEEEEGDEEEGATSAAASLLAIGASLMVYLQ